MKAREYLLAAITIASSTSYAWDSESYKAAWNSEKNIQSGRSDAHTIYNNSGISGSVSSIQNCFKQVGKLPPKSVIKFKKLQYCIALDITSQQIDSAMSSANGWPQQQYLEIGNVKARSDKMKEFFPGQPDLQEAVGEILQILKN